jgi:hypothetical protein
MLLEGASAPGVSGADPMGKSAPASLLLATACVIVGGSWRAGGPDESTFGELPPPVDAARESAPAPALAFHLLAEIPLPGPLAEIPARLVGEFVEIPVATGIVRARPEPGAPVQLEATEGAPAVDATSGAGGWAEDPSGRFRVRADAAGWIVAERRAGARKPRWKRAWRLRVAGSTLTPPLALDERVYFGALDNQVYCVRLRNGHRVWVTDAGGRVSRPFVPWGGDAQAPPLILVVPDGGATLLALSRATGAPVASVAFEPEDGRLVGVPVTTPDGKVVIARQRYDARAASLMVYRLDAGAAPAGAGAAGVGDTSAPAAAVNARRTESDPP